MVDEWETFNEPSAVLISVPSGSPFLTQEYIEAYGKWVLAVERYGSDLRRSRSDVAGTGGSDLATHLAEREVSSWAFVGNKGYLHNAWVNL